MLHLNFSGLRKYHFHVFRANLLGVILGVFFFRAYAAKAIPMTPIIAILLGITAFLIGVAVVLKPTLNLKGILPAKGLLVFNLLIALAVSMLFVKEIGALGVLFCMLLSFFLSEVGHFIHGRAK
ncbi:MAG: hypothetical protein V1702_03410 [Candidatus Woesearchaeota archaeon]